MINSSTHLGASSDGFKPNVQSGPSTKLDTIIVRLPKHAVYNPFQYDYFDMRNCSEPAASDLDELKGLTKELKDAFRLTCTHDDQEKADSSRIRTVNLAFRIIENQRHIHHLQADAWLALAALLKPEDTIPKSVHHTTMESTLQAPKIASSRISCLNISLKINTLTSRDNPPITYLIAAQLVSNYKTPEALDIDPTPTSNELLKTADELHNSMPHKANDRLLFNALRTKNAEKMDLSLGSITSSVG